MTLEMLKLPISDWVDTFVWFLIDNLGPLFDAITFVLGSIVSSLESSFLWVPVPVMIIIIVLLGWKFGGRGVAIFNVLTLLLLVSMELWEQTMSTLALIIAATLVALVIGIPMGIWASRSDPVWRVIRPILDLMQTLPIFVYLIPAVMLFGIGMVPAAIATIVFSMPPAIRLTNLGIRHVPKEVIEAAAAFGSTKRQILTKVQLPLAMPSIMAGVNQVIMLSLSMVVIAAMIGAGGLGGVVYRAITRMEIGTGAEGGIAVVILAVILDRITQSFGKGPAKSEES